MTTYTPTNRHRSPPGPVPARCLQCEQVAVMEVQHIPIAPNTLGWQVKCQQCGADWQPGYPLIAPRKGEHTPLLESPMDSPATTHRAVDTPCYTRRATRPDAQIVQAWCWEGRWWLLFGRHTTGALARRLRVLSETVPSEPPAGSMPL